MASDKVEQARRSIRTQPVVRSATATRKLASSLRRLGADSQTVAKLTEPAAVQPAAPQ